NAGAAERIPDRRLVYVHDFRCGGGGVHAASGPEPGGKPPAGGQAQPPEDPAHDRVADDAPQPLVAQIIGAQHVAVHQQDPLAVQIDDRAVVDEPATCVPAEALAQHEVAVAVHHET